MKNGDAHPMTDISSFVNFSVGKNSQEILQATSEIQISCFLDISPFFSLLRCLSLAQ